MKKIGIYNKIFYYFLILFIILILLFAGFQIKFDGSVFIITGERILNGLFDKIYTPTGNAPWTYISYVASYFSLYVLFGADLGYKMFLVSNVVFLFSAVFLLIDGCIKINLNNWKQLIFLLFAFFSFWFVIWESLYIGQVDMTLLFLLILALNLFLKDKFFLYAFILAILVSFKPQFLVFLIPAIFYKKYKSILSFFMFFPIFFLIYYLFAGFDNFVPDLQSYFETSSSIASNAIGAVNQSFQSVFSMLFINESHGGRFDPVWYASNLLYYKIYILPQIVQVILPWLYKTICIVYALYVIHKKPFDSNNENKIFSFIILSSLIPTLSPVFWQVHMIYMIPAVIWLSFKVLINNNFIFYKIIFIFTLFVIAISNPLIVGNKVADMIQSFGVYYFSSMIFFILVILFAQKDKIYRKNKII